MSINETVKFWSENPCFDVETQKAAQQLLADDKQKEREECFGSLLEFGTGGLRGIMGVGTNRINKYTVQMATEGVAKVIETRQKNTKATGVVIGYDSRHRSFEFAKVSAEVLAAHGIPVYLFKEIAPTPLVSCELLRRSAIAGIIITASHNPPEYNGFKVYWENGGQIVPPEDNEIIDEVKNIIRIDLIPNMPFEEALKDGKVEWVEEEADEYYLKTVGELSLGDVTNNSQLGVIFTPFHGTGGRLVPKLLKQQGFEKVKTVEEQMVPDGDFSTVPSPNPENEDAFVMAVSQATANDELIMANDPDADRLGVMVRDKNRKWNWLTGNQIGALLLDHILTRLKALNRLPDKGVFITTVVTSPLTSRMALANGLQVREVLTGFKWIRQAALKFEQETGGKYLFGMEESHGYLMGTHSGDKDGIWAALAFAEMVALLKAQGLTALERLDQIHQEYGIHLDALQTQTLSGNAGLAQIQKIMHQYRNSPPASLGGKKIIQITDLLENTVFDAKTSQTKPGPGLPASNVIALKLEDESRLTVRPSGTEPKIKYYFNLSGNDLEQLQSLLEDIKADLQ